MDVIDSYSRKQAIDDGVLVDVSEMAREAGFKFPTALTRAVWNEYVSVPDDVSCQDEKGRLWDILCMLRFRIRLTKHEHDGNNELLKADSNKAFLAGLA